MCKVSQIPGELKCLTLEGVHIEALVFPHETRSLEVIFQEITLSIIGGNNAVLFVFFLELLSKFKDGGSLSRVLC